MSEKAQVIDNLRDMSCLYCGNMFTDYQWIVGSLCMKCSFPSKYSKIIKEMITDEEEKNKVKQIFYAVMSRSFESYKQHPKTKVDSQ